MNSDERTVFSLGAFAVAVGAISLAVVAIFLVRDGGGDASAGPAPASIDVELGEFSITPSSLDIPAEGARLRVTNTGSMVHNFAVPQLGIDTGDLNPGASTTVTVDGGEVGMYDVICTIPGHADSGMKAMVHVGMGGGMTTAAQDGGQPVMDPEEMDRMMEEVALRFPAETAGHGGEPLEPTILADGTKRFELTAEIVDWEVEPGKIVKAWTYNGVVPGPEIHVDVGDKVAGGADTTSCPSRPSIHFHGVRVPNAMDGVDPYTQDPIKPGETFTYEFTADRAGGRHVPLAPRRPDPGPQRAVRSVPDRRDADARRSSSTRATTNVDQQVNMVLNDAGTIGLSLNGKSFPATEAYIDAGRRRDAGQLLQRGADGAPDAPAPADRLDHRQGRDPARGPDARRHDQRSPPASATRCCTRPRTPGVWAWHCHILNHAEGPTGMFGMVTALIVEE